MAEGLRASDEPDPLRLCDRELLMDAEEQEVVDEEQGELDAAEDPEEYTEKESSDERGFDDRLLDGNEIRTGADSIVNVDRRVGGRDQHT